MKNKESGEKSMNNSNELYNAVRSISGVSETVEDIQRSVERLDKLNRERLEIIKKYNSKQRNAE